MPRFKSCYAEGTIIVNSLLLGFGASSEGQRWHLSKILRIQLNEASLYAQLEALGLRPVFSGSPRDTEFLSPSDRLLRIRGIPIYFTAKGDNPLYVIFVECASDFDVLLTLRSNGRIYSELLQNIAEVSTAVQKRRVGSVHLRWFFFTRVLNRLLLW